MGPMTEMTGSNPPATGGHTGIGRYLSMGVGASMAVALVAGATVWTYRLGVRDTGALPLLRADRGAIKERPADPGGLVALHQDVTSYGVVDGGAPLQAATMVAAPPPEPAAEDIPMGDLQDKPLPVAAAIAEPPAAPIVRVLDDENAEAAAALPDGVGPDKPAPAHSPPAPARPGNLGARAVAAVAEAAAAESDLVVRAAASPVQIQLMADPSEDTIRRVWQRVQRQNPALLANRALSVQTTKSGGQLLYRLRVGPFRDGAEARALCTALKDRGQDCIVVRNG